MQENLAKAAQQNIEAWAQNEFEYRRRVEDLERETKSVQVGLVCVWRVSLAVILSTNDKFEYLFSQRTESCKCEHAYFYAFKAICHEFTLYLIITLTACKDKQ